MIWFHNRCQEFVIDRIVFTHTKDVFFHPSPFHLVSVWIFSNRGKVSFIGSLYWIGVILLLCHVYLLQLFVLMGPSTSMCSRLMETAIGRPTMYTWTSGMTLNELIYLILLCYVRKQYYNKPLMVLWLGINTSSFIIKSLYFLCIFPDWKKVLNFITKEFLQD